MIFFALDSGDMYSSPRPLQFISNMGLIVHAVRCGRTHTLILTNNGVSFKEVKSFMLVMSSNLC